MDQVKNKMVYICHPVSRLGAMKAKIFADTASHYVKEKGYIPLSSVKAFEDVLDNQKDYEKALMWCKDLIHCCSEIWVFDNNLSYGMMQELEYASKLNLQIKFITNMADSIDVPKSADEENFINIQGCVQ